MAENTTTYKAVIDTEVKGADEMEDLGDKAEETAGKFQKLQLQIRQVQKDLQAAEAAGDKVKFNKLKKELDDLEDGLEAVQLKSKQFDDQLASLPGPAGAAGNAIKGIE
jgi:predicted nuclease with TOPRIM domain